jgi:hypothetical protein
MLYGGPLHGFDLWSWGGGGGISERGGLHEKGTGLTRRIRGDIIA